MFNSILKMLPDLVKCATAGPNMETAPLRRTINQRKNEAVKSLNKLIGVMVTTFRAHMEGKQQSRQDKQQSRNRKGYFALDKTITAKKKELTILKLAIKNKSRQEMEENDDNSIATTVEDLKEEFNNLKLEIKILTEEKTKALNEMKSGDTNKNKHQILGITIEEDENDNN